MTDDWDHTSLTSGSTPRSSSFLLKRVERVDRLAEDEECNLAVINSIRNWPHTKKHVSTDLDIAQGDGIMQKLKYAAKQ